MVENTKPEDAKVEEVVETPEETVEETVEEVVEETPEAKQEEEAEKVEVPKGKFEKEAEARAKKKSKTIKVKSDRVLNLGKIDGPFSAIVHFQPGETKEIPYNERTQDTIDHHIDVGLLKKVK